MKTQVICFRNKRSKTKMNPAANDWASSDPTQNITLADANQFKNQLAAALAVQFADTYVKTASGEIVNETELRRNPFPAAPVNLWGRLAGVGAAAVNVAQMRTAVRSAAQSNNPAGEIETIFQQALPKSDVPNMILRVPAVMIAIGTAIAQIS
jgi:hypothetical protein